MTEAATTSRGVDPLIEGDADQKKKHNIYFVYLRKNVQVEGYLWVKPDQYQYEHTKSNIAVVQQVA